MSDRRSKRARGKKMKKLKNTFLLTSKQCWLIDEKLIPLYQHLVDDYSIKLREEWTVKVEEMDIETTPQVKEEPEEDDYLVEPQALQVNNTSNQFKVIFPLLFSSSGG